MYSHSKICTKLQIINRAQRSLTRQETRFHSFFVENQSDSRKKGNKLGNKATREVPIDSKEGRGGCSQRTIGEVNGWVDDTATGCHLKLPDGEIADSSGGNLQALIFFDSTVR